MILKADNLTKHFDAQRRLFLRSRTKIRAVDGVTFQIRRGSTFALVGESGCGKSTVARLLTCLLEPTDGAVLFEGHDIFCLPAPELRKMRQKVQMIFQDPYSSFNPRWTVRSILSEPLRAHGIGTSIEREQAIDAVVDIVGLSSDCLSRYPHEFSGGQRQRIAIARALIANPSFIVCDEPVSALDVSIQAKIINLLLELQEKFGLTYLFITHDLRVVSFLSDEVAVMYLGKIVEKARTRDIFNSPLHPYTKILFSSIPVPDPLRRKQALVVKGDLPSPLELPTGCRFHTRCDYATQICAKKEPEVLQVGSEHFCACHLYDS